jgi:peptidylprolyl isomerase
MKIAGKGDKIKVHYTGRFEDGSVFDSSKGGDPLEFVIGEGQLIKDFENTVLGMVVGDSRTVLIAAENAYGPYREELLFEVPLARIPPEIVPSVGLALSLQRNGGDVLNVVVSAVTDKTVTLDANHVLAGKDLTFDIELVGIG